MDTAQITTLAEKALETLQGWLSTTVEMLPNIIVASLVIALFIFLSKLGHQLTKKGMLKVSDNREVPQLIATLVRVILFSCGLFIALGILKLDKTVTSLLAGVGVLGIVIGFAFQEIASNFIAGVILAIRRPFRHGDLVNIEGHLGTFRGLTLRITRVELFTGEMVYIPNSKVLSNAIVNHTINGHRRVDIPVGVSYAEDLDKAQHTAKAALESLSGRDSSRDVEVFFEAFGDSSINLTARVWMKSDGNYFALRSEGIKSIKREFDAANINIPFPIRTLDFPDVLKAELKKP